MTWATDRMAAAVTRTLSEAGETGTLRRMSAETYDPATRTTTGGGSIDTSVVLVPGEWTTLRTGEGATKRVRRLVMSPPGVEITAGMVVLDAAAAVYTVERASAFRSRGLVVAFEVLASGGAP
jgi:hypothetical protein